MRNGETFKNDRDHDLWSSVVHAFAILLHIYTSNDGKPKETQKAQEMATSN